MWACLKTEELRWGSPTATPPFEPLDFEEQKGSGLFFGSESEPRTEYIKCWKRDLTPFVQPSVVILGLISVSLLLSFPCNSVLIRGKCLCLCLFLIPCLGLDCKAGMYGNWTHWELCSNPPMVLKTKKIHFLNNP